MTEQEMQDEVASEVASEVAGFAETLHPSADDASILQAYLPTSCVQNHAANLCVLPDGDLACVWFGGTQEGLPDINIWFSRLVRGARRWQDPVRLSDDPERSEQNPILFPAPDGRLWLLYTSQRFGNQDTAIVRYRVSEDNGRSWGPIGTLLGRPGTFVRQPLVVLENGDWLLPVYRCHVDPGAKWDGSDDVSSVMISSDRGRTWSEHPVPGSTGRVHMNVALLPDKSLLALFRSRWADNIYSSRSVDGGRTWSVPVATELPNNNSSIQFTALGSGNLVLAFNDASAAQAVGRRASLYDEIDDGETTNSGASVAGAADTAKKRAFWGAPRAPLTLALSRDGGRTWPHKRSLEFGDGYCMTNNSAQKLNREYSYPSVTQGPDGAIHVAYTYFRQRIKYVRLAEAWISA